MKQFENLTKLICFLKEKKNNNKELFDCDNLVEVQEGFQCKVDDNLITYEKGSLCCISKIADSRCTNYICGVNGKVYDAKSGDLGVRCNQCHDLIFNKTEDGEIELGMDLKGFLSYCGNREYNIDDKYKIKIKLFLSSFFMGNCDKHGDNV